MNDTDILNYLENNPDLLHKIQLRFSKGTTSSLVEKKISNLTIENKQLKKTINESFSVSQENVELSKRIHTFTLEMLKNHSFSTFFEYLLTDFKDLLSFDEIIFLSENNQKDKNITHLSNFKFFNPMKNYYGTKNQYELDTICSPNIESIVMINIGQDKNNFIVLIGSKNKLRFTPDKDHYFINNLQQIMELKFSDLKK